MLVLPVALWFLYVRLHTPTSNPGFHLFRFPLMGWWEKISRAMFRLPDAKIEVAATLSITTQMFYLIIRPRLASAWWRWGIGWAVLAAVLGGGALTGQGEYCRILLPLTFVFNMLVYKHEQGRAYALWFLLGNAGMFGWSWMTAPRWLLLAWPTFECWSYWLAHRQTIASRASIFGLIRSKATL